MTKTEAAVFDVLRTGGQLTTTSLASKVGRAPWRVRRAARSLHRRGYICQDWSNRWRVYCTTAARHVR